MRIDGEKTNWSMGAFWVGWVLCWLSLFLGNLWMLLLGGIVTTVALALCARDPRWGKR